MNAYSGTNCTIKYPINAHPVFKFSTMWHYYTLLFVIILILPHTQMRIDVKRGSVLYHKDNHNTQISTRFQNEPRHPITQTNRKYIRLLQTLAWELPPSAERKGGSGWPEFLQHHKSGGIIKRTIIVLLLRWNGREGAASFVERDQERNELDTINSTPSSFERRRKRLSNVLVTGFCEKRRGCLQNEAKGWDDATEIKLLVYVFVPHETESMKFLKKKKEHSTS